MQNSAPDSQAFSTDPVVLPSVEELTPDQRAQEEKEQAAKEQRFDDIMALVDKDDQRHYHFLFVPDPNDRLFDSDVERYRINSAAHKIMQDRVFRACIDGKPLTYFQLVEGLPLCLGEGYNLPPVRRDVWESIAGKGLYYTLFEKFLRVSMRFMDIKSYAHCGCLITSVVTRGTLDIDCDYEYLSSVVYQK